MSPASQTVDGYLAALPDEQRATLRELRETIRAAVAEAVEGIGYGIPAYKYKSGAAPLDLETTRVIDAPGVTHITYRVVKDAPTRARHQPFEAPAKA